MQKSHGFAFGVFFHALKLSLSLALLNNNNNKTSIALGVATGWLLNRYARDSIDKAYKKFKAAL